VEGDERTEESIAVKKAARNVAGHCASRARRRDLECGKRGNVPCMMR